MKKLKRGCIKYKGKLPFKCFHCGKIGRFSYKCPYRDNRDNNDEEDHNRNERRKTYKGGISENNKRSNKQKKSLYSKENSSSLDDDSDDDPKELLFMDIKEEHEDENFGEQEQNALMRC